ncbi:MAG: UDP-N-acetylglucosamine pyrophosphorylase [Lachnospiraceae bacterium]|nr:UDP-N-acetylglucosamine pyrophosphorylase [Lachnospiraceae bacterium]
MSEITIKNMYSLEHTMAGRFLEALTYPWEALPNIKNYILEIGKTLDKDEYEEISPDVWVHKTANVFESAYIAGPSIIGPETEVRQCAFIRGNALVGAGCVVGNSTELKNVIIFDNVQVPHYNYVGDSLLGYKSHMGAGSITSNVKSDKTLVHVKGKNSEGMFDIDTGLKKFGAMLGDCVEVGCNSVLNPGSVIGSNTNIYPLSPVRGYVPADSIYKTGGVIAAKSQ